LRAFDLLAQLANHQGAAETVLLRETGGIYGFEARQEFALLLQVGFVEGGRVIAEAIVIAFITQSGCELRVHSQFVLPLFIEERVQSVKSGVRT
jgi:hypothetical protein